MATGSANVSQPTSTSSTNQFNLTSQSASFASGHDELADGLLAGDGSLAADSFAESTWSIFTDQVPQTKLFASLILFLMTMLCGYLPVRILLNQNYVQYAMFAGGGVLMATAFCHLIPEAHDNYKLSAHHQHPLAVVGHFHHHHNHMHDEHTQTPTTNATSTAPHLHDHSMSSSLNVPYLEVTLCCGFFFMYLVEQLMVRFINNHTHDHPCDTGSGHLVGSIDSHSNTALATGSTSAAGSTIGVANLSSAAIVTPSSTGTELYKFIRGLLIVSAFGAHSIFDGVAIGSQESVEKVWTIFIAISCHKLIIAAVVGLELYAATLESHLWTLVHLSLFSIMSPIGIVLVVLAQNSLHINSNHPAMILLQSFATGTLLYIVFIEILQPKEDQAYEKNRIGKSFSLIGGFALMLLVLTLIDE